jgi:hypothetical protein
MGKNKDDKIKRKGAGTVSGAGMATGTVLGAGTVTGGGLAVASLTAGTGKGAASAVGLISAGTASRHAGFAVEEQSCIVNSGFLFSTGLIGVGEQAFSRGQSSGFNEVKDNVYGQQIQSREHSPPKYIALNCSKSDGSVPAVVRSLNAKFEGAAGLSLSKPKEEWPPLPSNGNVVTMEKELVMDLSQNTENVVSPMPVEEPLCLEGVLPPHIT